MKIIIGLAIVYSIISFILFGIDFRYSDIANALGGIIIIMFSKKIGTSYFRWLRGDDTTKQKPLDEVEQIWSKIHFFPFSFSPDAAIWGCRICGAIIALFSTFEFFRHSRLIHLVQ
jgi:hypothetical protein